MTDSHNDSVPKIELRVPGPWKTLRDLMESLNAAGAEYEVDLSNETELRLIHISSQQSVAIDVFAHDDEISELFLYSNHPPTEQELREIANHAVKIHVSGPGGSPEAARIIVDAAAALLRAGGAGVFVDNSGAVHGRTDWLTLSDDTKMGGIYWCFVVLTRGEDGEVYSTGMHCLGFREAELPGPVDSEQAFSTLHQFLGYIYQSGQTVLDGDLLGDEEPADYRAVHEPCVRFPPGTAFHNPYGVIRLASVE